MVPQNREAICVKRKSSQRVLLNKYSNVDGIVFPQSPALPSPCPRCWPHPPTYNYGRQPLICSHVQQARTRGPQRGIFSPGCLKSVCIVACVAFLSIHSLSRTWSEVLRRSTHSWIFSKRRHWRYVNLASRSELLDKDNIRLNVIGRTELLPESVQCDTAESLSRHNSRWPPRSSIVSRNPSKMARTPNK